MPPTSRRRDGIPLDSDSVKVQGEPSSSTAAPPVVALPGGCRHGICGEEAACRRVSATSHVCVCPHDNSPPTGPDLRCPNRVTVPLTPSPIHNIIPPPGMVNASKPDVLSTKHHRHRERHNSTSSPPVGAQVPQSVQMHPTARASVLVAAPSTSVAVTVAAAPDNSHMLNSEVAVIVCGLLLVVSIVASALLAKCVRKRRPNHRTPSNPLYVTPGLARRAGLTTLPLPPSAPPPSPPGRFGSGAVDGSGTSTPVVDHIPREILTLHDPHIGEGCFGKVYKGELVMNGRSVTVAVKMLKESASRETEDDFMREVEVMSGFKHPHILTLLGVVPRDSAHWPWMVFEFMAFGDLTGVLRSGRTDSPSKQKIPSLGTADLIRAAHQVSLGMTYLAGQHFVHRDLACRNCLVGEDFTVKIADFGMSRDVYTCDYYRVRSGVAGTRMLPVRWMAPEALRYGKFTLESDVWSFGVLLWEVMSHGTQPYFGKCNEEVVHLVMEGQLLIPPSDCPNAVADLMMNCWQKEPKNRVGFPEISARLEAALAEAALAEAALAVEIRPQRLPRPPARPVALPRPPSAPAAPSASLLPPSGFADTGDDTSCDMDPENYLLPRVSAPEENLYLQPLPD